MFIHINPGFQQLLILLDLIWQRPENTVNYHQHVKERPLRLNAIKLFQLPFIVVSSALIFENALVTVPTKAFEAAFALQPPQNV